MECHYAIVDKSSRELLAGRDHFCERERFSLIEIIFLSSRYCVFCSREFFLLLRIFSQSRIFLQSRISLQSRIFLNAGISFTVDFLNLRHSQFTYQIFPALKSKGHRLPEQRKTTGTTKHPRHNGNFERGFSENEELLLVLRKIPIKVFVVSALLRCSGSQCFTVHAYIL